MNSTMSLHLKLRHLEVFNALIEAGSVSRAATKLNLTQPAVSVALSNLEAELGFKLFNRSKGFFVPTTEASLLHIEVEQGLFAVSRIEQRVHEIRSGRTGGVCIAANGVLAINFLPKLIADFQRDHPGINIEMRVQNSRRIASWVSTQQIDIGFIDLPVPVAGLNAQIFNLESFCIMHKDDALCANEIISPEILAGRSVISITGDHMIDRQLNELFSERNISVTRSFSSYYFAIARNMVAQGGNVAIVDSINAKVELNDDVVWRPFQPRIDSKIAMITSREQPLGQAARALAELLQSRLEEECSTAQI